MRSVRAAATVAAALAFVAAGCGSGSPGNPSLFSKSTLTAPELASLARSVGSGQPSAFHTEVTGTIASLKVSYRSVGSIQGLSSSQMQTNAHGTPFRPSDIALATSFPVVAIVSSRSRAYWEAWGSLKSVLASANLNQGWVSASLADVSNPPPAAGRILLVFALADPEMYLDLLQSGAATAHFLRTSSFHGSPARLFTMEVPIASAASAMTGFDGALLNFVGGTLGSSSKSTSLPVSVWIRKNGTLAGVSTTTGSTSNPNFPKMKATIYFSTFATGEKPPSPPMAPPPGKQTVTLTNLVKALAKTKPSPTESKADTETPSEAAGEKETTTAQPGPSASAPPGSG
jgi:hypothetical protein